MKVGDAVKIQSKSRVHASVNGKIGRVRSVAGRRVAVQLSKSTGTICTVQQIVKL